MPLCRSCSIRSRARHALHCRDLGSEAVCAGCRRYSPSIQAEIRARGDHRGRHNVVPQRARSPAERNAVLSVLARKASDSSEAGESADQIPRERSSSIGAVHWREPTSRIQPRSPTSMRTIARFALVGSSWGPRLPVRSNLSASASACSGRHGNDAERGVMKESLSSFESVRACCDRRAQLTVSGASPALTIFWVTTLISSLSSRMLRLKTAKLSSTETTRSST